MTAEEKRTPAIIVHGGAWAIPDDLAGASVDGVKRAVLLAYNKLLDGHSAMDAVEAAVNELEDDPAFDAGTGSVLNLNGEIEMDAMIMEGKELRAGAVAGVHRLRNPVSLARLVLTKTDHVMLVGEGADDFAKAMGVPQASVEELTTLEARMELEYFKKFRRAVDESFKQGHDTVGAVAMDIHGHIACATSTGGITAKMPGRVGDSPLVGSGGYADDTAGGVSCTGHGESITKICMAHAIVQNMQDGCDPKAAIERALYKMESRVKGYGGAIAISHLGHVGYAFTTQRMAWASVKDGLLQYGLDRGQCCEMRVEAGHGRDSHMIDNAPA